MVNGNSCSVVVNEVSGDVDITNSYKYVLVKGTRGSIQVHGDSSPIDVSDIRALPKGARIDLVTSYKPVTLVLPADADVKVLANTQYGKIRSDFPVYLDSESGENKNVHFELGNASASVRVETSADIILKKN